MYEVEHSDKILQHLSKFGSITSREAIDEYGIFRVDRYISYLKKQGYKIDLEWNHKEDENGNRICSGIYRLIETSV